MNTMVINPDPAFTDRIRSQLEREGYNTAVATDVASALVLLEDHRPDFLIVDREILVSEGQVLLRTLQQHGDLPILFLTSAKNSERALQSEAPNLDRIERVLRRVKAALAEDLPVVRLGELLIDVPKKRAVFRGKRLPLTPIQFRLLSYLAKRAGEVVNYRELLRRIWGYEGDDQEAKELLKVHVRQIRRKMGLQVKDGQYLVSARGFGYMLIDPDEDQTSQ
ncbi:MAG: response regulator transcription factor [Anaerolineae bacterium]|nr:response regulator transcription factor [Anaerolineae bacterium]